ncbi:hypothetical protein [Spiroplasma endosymbiont of Dasysyrphus albostriatus]
MFDYSIFINKSNEEILKKLKEEIESWDENFYKKNYINLTIMFIIED